MDSVQEQLALLILVTIVLNILILLVFSMLSPNKDKKISQTGLPVSFTKANGKLQIIGERLAFIDNDEAELSFAIERSNIIDLSRKKSTLTIQTKEPVNAYLEKNCCLSFRISKEKKDDLKKWFEEVKEFFPARK